MVLDWLAKGKPATLPELLARKQYGKAVEMAQAAFNARPRDGRLQLQLADVLVAAGRGREAVPLLRSMADELAAEGFAAKAIAILKRIQKIEPGRDIEERLAALIEDRTRQQGSAPPRAAAPALPDFGMEEIGDDSSGVDLGLNAASMGAPPTPGDVAPAPAAVPPPVAAGDAPHGPALFPDFSKDELIAVMDGLRLSAYEPGDLVVAEGEPGESLFLVTSGEVKAWIRNREGRYVLVRQMTEGDFFGEISVLTGSPRTATVVAASWCELLELDRPTLDSITTAYPRVRDVLERFHRQRLATSADVMAPPGAA
jgi:cAMP-dependent protein kinase regulator